MIVGTAGHIDHGKTTLVRALTGVDTDRLEEEKARGISIELGYAYIGVDGPTDGDPVLGFVDVPGHERLVHTMVAGAGGIDFALLVVAADDGVMPQTREHVAILDLLGVARGAVALSKADRVDAARLRGVEAQIAALLAPTGLRGAPIFPLDATAAADPGLAALRSHLHAAAATAARRSEAGLFRLAVDRVFTLTGHGTVVTGTVRSGRVQVGDTVRSMPKGLDVRVRGLHAQNREAPSGRAGQRCALNLAGIEKSALERGDWLADARLLQPSRRIDVRLRLLRDGAATLRNWTPLHVHVGTAHQVAHTVLLDGERLSAGESGLVQLVFERPMCAVAGDRLVVRDAQAMRTIGGGVVLDACAPERRRRSAPRLAWLAAVERLLDGEGIAPLLEQAPHGVALRDLVRLCAAEPERIALPETAHRIDTADGAHVFHIARWQALREGTLAALHAFHERQPDEPGIDGGRLRRLVEPALADAAWRRLLDDLVAERAVRRTGPWLHLPEHRVDLDEDERRLMRQLHPLIEAGRFDPPWVRDLARQTGAAEDRVRTTLRKAVTGGEVHQVVRDLFYTGERVDELAAILRDLVLRHGPLEAARYRDAIGLGRKRTVQILEFFDRVGYTRRVRDAHVLRADSSWLERNGATPH
ncbi:selenocysteine-specific translation elongation factor [Dokdonella sp.]|uniref:selenocysteine-specific translation elongation factor n=1 Tax=Dokdonella sp. TaxID=2291710 RepID=UPI001B0D86CE|nr:selenocysteine-specific translation elongation factor [Dokdonella sp.]MBO9664573.1 selenocysteine-specific translation elongation factor [Dokdonella sp.]